MLPRIEMAPDGLGFGWLTPAGQPTTLAQLIAQPDAEADRWLPTHLEAFDDVLIEVAERFGQVLGGARRLAPGEPELAQRAYVSIDRSSVEYADASAALPPDLRAGQILGTGALMSIRLREALQLMGPAPFDGALDQPTVGVVSGHAELQWVAEAEPWRGARWVVVCDDGRRLPATLSMLLQDSSGVDAEATVQQHRDALGRVSKAVESVVAEPMAASGAIDWLLFDWVMAHRESADSGAVEIKSGQTADSAMIVTAVAASTRVRAQFDPMLLHLFG